MIQRAKASTAREEKGLILFILNIRADGLNNISRAGLKQNYRLPQGYSGEPLNSSLSHTGSIVIAFEHRVIYEMLMDMYKIKGLINNAPRQRRNLPYLWPVVRRCQGIEGFNPVLVQRMRLHKLDAIACA